MSIAFLYKVGEVAVDSELTITLDARLHWIICFEEALQPIVEEKLSSEEHIQSFWNYLNVFSIWMINTRG